MISAIVHTFNEEKNIGRCLNSLNWVDEVVLVDMGSTDRTRLIASEFKAKIYDYPYTGFVEPARNFGLEKAKNDWIFVVDADEEVSTTLAEYLVKVSKEEHANFFRIPRKNIIFNRWIKHAGWWPDYQIRFFQKGAVEWTDKIHGVPITKGEGLDMEAKESLSIIHYNYNSVGQFIERLNRYSTIYAKQLFLSNEKFDFRQLFERPTREFTARYFLLKGYKEGVHGLALSFLQAASELVTYLKLWELSGYKRQTINLEDVDKELKNELKMKVHNLMEAELESYRSGFWRFILKLKRRIFSYA